MNKKRTGLALLFLAIFCGGGAMAVLAARKEASVTNRIRTGVVDIRLKEYQIKDGEEQAYEDPETVLPGQYISKIPRIENLGNDCYIRAAIRMEGSGEVLRLYGMDPAWTLAKDGYYYYKKELKQGQQTELFHGVRIPESISKKEEGKKLALNIQVDAIQSRNFAPDYETKQPWGNVRILKSAQKGAYNMAVLNQRGAERFQVEYHGQSGELVAEGEDFFRNFPALLPGDLHREQVSLENKGDKGIPLYIRRQGNQEGELSEQIHLAILLEKEGSRSMVYEGTLNGEPLQQDIFLGTFQPGEAGTLQVQVSLPSETDNRFSLLGDQTTWIFSTEQENTPAVKTGDSMDMGKVIFVFTALLGSASAVTALYLRKGGRIW